MKKFFIGFSLVCLFASCKKDLNQNPAPDVPSVSKRPTVFPTTADEKHKVGLIKEITEIVKEAYLRNPLAIKEVNDLIRVGYYKDQYVFLDDLLKPETSKLYASPRTAQVQNKGAFKQAFLNEVASKNAGMRTTDTDISRYLQDDISIYFPYADYYEETPVITPVPADREGDEAPGFVSNGRGGYTEVSASDEYSKTNPSHLLAITAVDRGEAIVYEKAQETLPAGRCGVTYFGTPENQLPAPPASPGAAQPNEIRQAYIGYSRCKQNYDAWISFTGNGGGSEIMYSRGDGYLKFADDHVTDFQDVIPVNHSRSDISDERALYVLAAWDYQWEPGNNQQYFAIWEEDNKGSVTFKFSVSTTVSLNPAPNPSTGTGTIGFDFTKKSQDAIIRQFQIDYNTFFRDGRNDQGHGFLLGFDMRKAGFCNYNLTYKYDYSYIPNNQAPWPKRDWRSGVSWTWPYKII